MPIWIKNNGAWENIVPQINDAGTWKTPSQAYIKNNGEWKPLLGTGEFSLVDTYSHSAPIIATEYDTNEYIYIGGGATQPEYFPVRKLNSSNLTETGDEYTGHSSTINTLELGSDGYLYSGSSDTEVHKIDPSNMTQVDTFTGHSSDVEDLVYGSDGYLYSCDGNGIIYKIDPSNMSQVNSANIGNTAKCIDYSSGYLYIGSTDGESTSQVYKINSSDMSEDVVYNSTYAGTTNSLAYGNDGYLYADTPGEFIESRSLQKIDPSDMSLILSYIDDNLNGAINSIIYWSDGYVYVGFGSGEFEADNGYVQVINPSDMSKVSEYTGHSDTVNTISGGESYIYSGSNDNELHKLGWV